MDLDVGLTVSWDWTLLLLVQSSSEEFPLCLHHFDVGIKSHVLLLLNVTTSVHLFNDARPWLRSFQSLSFFLSSVPSSRLLFWWKILSGPRDSIELRGAKTGDIAESRNHPRSLVIYKSKIWWCHLQILKYFTMTYNIEMGKGLQKSRSVICARKMVMSSLTNMVTAVRKNAKPKWFLCMKNLSSGSDFFGRQLRADKLSSASASKQRKNPWNSLKFWRGIFSFLLYIQCKYSFLH